MNRQKDRDQFYGLLKDLKERHAGYRELRSCTAKSGWPERGIYFFFEEGELRDDGSPRVTRVGTHAITDRSKASLWNRLAAHRGVLSTGGGNHRSSIFRLLIGEAFIERNGWNIPSWGAGNSLAQAVSKTGLPREEIKRAEAPIEILVSDYVEKMPVLWLAVPDEPSPNSLRSVIERNSIALLSGYGSKDGDLPSSSWLGHGSSKREVRESGLWNNRHIQDQYDVTFLDSLETIIKT